MALRSLIVKIGADTASLEKALATVGASTKTLDEGLKKLGNTPLGQQAQKDAERLAKSMDALRVSQEQMAARATAVAAGIERIGGTARLTTSQLASMSKQVRDGLDAYRALGREAPQELQRVAKAIDQTLKRPLPSSKTLLQQLIPSLPAGNLLGPLATSGVSAATLATGIGAVAASFGIATKKALDYADALTKASDRTGIGVEALQRLDAIAVASGNTLDNITGAVNQFQNRLASGNKDVAQALSQIGLSIDEIRSLSPDQQFIAIAKGIQGIKDPAEQTRVAIELFGQAGAELLPTLKSNIDEVAASATIMSAESVKALDDFGDAVVAAARNTAAFVGEFAGKVITITLKINRFFSDSGGGFSPETLGVGGAGFDFGAPGLDVEIRRQLEALKVPKLKVDVGILPTIDPQAASAATDALLGTTAEQLKATQAALRHAQALEAVNDKIRLLSAPIQTLTAHQQALVFSYQALGLSNDDIALKLGITKRSIDAFDASLESLNAGFASHRANTEAAHSAIGKLDLGYLKASKSVGVLRQATLTLTAAQAAQFAPKATLESINTLERFNKHALRLGEITDRNTGTMRQFREEDAKARRELEETVGSVKDLAEALTRLSQTTRGAFRGLVLGAATGVNALDALDGSIDQIRAGAQLIQTDFSKGLRGVTQGLLGIVGTAFSVAGAITQAFEQIELGRIFHDVARDFGVEIQQATADAIREMEKSLARSQNRLNNAVSFRKVNLAGAQAPQPASDFREAATLLNLPAIIADAGGVAAFGLAKAEAEARKLFSIFERGEISLKQLGSTFDTVFAQLAPAAISKTSKLASEQFVELQRLALDRGLQSPAVDQFRAVQINDGVIGGLARFTKGAADAEQAIDGLNDKIKELNDQRAELLDGKSVSELGDADKKRIADLDRQLGLLQAQKATQEQIRRASEVKSQAAATGLGGAVAASFVELQRQGLPLLDIVKQLDPVITALQQQFDRTGFSGGAAFDTIREFAALAKDEIAGPALESIVGIQDVLAGLSNTGFLTQDVFAGLTDQVGQTFQALVDQGKDGNQILKLMAPTLQAIFELQQRTGFAVDETTQNLLAQAQAQGIVGEQFKSVGERTVDGLDRIGDTLDAIAKAFGVQLPEAAKKAAAGIDASLGNLDPDIDGTGIIDGLTNPLKDAAEAGSGATNAMGVLIDKIKLDLPGSTDPFDQKLQVIGRNISVGLPTETRNAVRDINDAFAGIREPRVKIHIEWDIPEFPGIRGAAGGGVIQPLSEGGRVLPFASARALRRGTDTVPALLTPGEIVLNAAQQKRLASALSGGVTVNGITVTIAPPPGSDGRQMVAMFLEQLRSNAQLYEGISNVARRSARP